MPGYIFPVRVQRASSAPRTGYICSWYLKRILHFSCRILFFLFYKRLPTERNNGANTSETIVISLIRILIDGPEVSLKGSPTVSPTTAALCASLPFPP